MSINAIKIVLVLSLVSLLAACQKPPCDHPMMYCKFMGFDTADVTSFRVTNYERGSNFTKSLGSVDLNYSWTNVSNKDYLLSNTDHDIKIELFPIGRTYKIKDIFFGNQKYSTARQFEHCSTSTTYVLNDSTRQHASFISEYNGTINVELKK